MKKFLRIALILGVMVSYLLINNNMTDKAINDCINGGNTETFCVENLNK